MFSSIIGGLGSLVGLAEPFLETPEEQNAHEQQMSEIEKEIAKYQTETRQAELALQESITNSQTIQKIAIGGGLAVAGIVALKMFVK